MIIERLQVQNYRSLADIDLHCEQLTALIGANGVGKSSVLKALEAFYDVAAKVGQEDFFNRNHDSEIVIRVTYGHLTEEERQEFAAYIHSDQLVVTKRIGATGTQAYYGTANQIPEFAQLRKLPKGERRNGFNELVEKGKFPDLRSKVRSADAADEAMDAFEREHRELAAPIERPEQFFGPKEVGGGKLDKFTKFVLVPAVRNAAAEAEKRGIISELIEMIVLRQVNARQDVQQLKADFEERVKVVYSSDNLTELGELAGEVSELLGQYAPGSRFNLLWGEVVPPRVPLPPADPRLIENDYDSPLSHAGNGVQRLLVLSLLQYMATCVVGTDHASVEDPFEDESSDNPAVAARSTPDLIIAIEEPELYLHPARARYLARLFRKLTTPSIAASTGRNQIVYATHSPYFVDLERFDQVRLARRVQRDGAAAASCELTRYSLAEASQTLAKVTASDPSVFTRESFKTRSVALFTSAVNEGFFSKAVLVVEGTSDVAAFMKLQEIMGQDWDQWGISIIPAGGKANVDRPVVTFRGLGIPTYFVVDGDAKTNDKRTRQSAAAQNRNYQRLLGNTEVLDYPETDVGEQGAIFHDKMETEIQAAIGVQVYSELRAAVAEELDLTQSAVTKNMEAMSQLVERIYKEGHRVPVLEEIIQRVSDLADVPARHDASGVEGEAVPVGIA